MGRLLDGRWVTHDLGADAEGRCIRRATQFRNMDNISPEAGRYLLILSWACGWSHRTMLVRAYLGLEDVIPGIICDPFMGDEGWTIHKGVSRERLFQYPANQEEDGDVKITRMHQIYELAQEDYTGRASVPVLWDTKEGTIVNNESSDIIRILLDRFASLGTAGNTPELLPPASKDSIQEMIQLNYGPINNGVYRCGFASSQSAYDEAAEALFARLDELEELLGKQRYLLGEQLTLADFCLFPTLVRFDHVYHTHFKCNRRHIYEYPNLWGWTREIYQLPGVKATCQFDDIREHYYTSHESIHPRRYVPLGPVIDFDSPHERDKQTF